MEEILFGAAIGLASGLNPGPVLTLVVTSTLERGFGAGARVAMAPLITDAPLITLCVLALRNLAAGWLAALGLVGGLVVVVLGVRTGLTARHAELPAPDATAERRDWWRGIVVNALNPNAWLFWATVGAPLLIRLTPDRTGSAIGFMLAFFLLLVGSKLAVAALLAKGRHRLTVRGYRLTMTACSILLIVFGVLLAQRGWRTLLETAPPPVRVSQH